MLAVVRNTPYNIVLVIHLLTVMAAFAPSFVHPFLVKQTKELDGDGHQKVLNYLALNGRRIYAPALILVGLTGFALSGMSEKFYSVTDGWVLASIAIWVAMNGILHAVLIPNERRAADGDAKALGLVEKAGGVLTILLLVMLYLMVFKPGA